MNCLFCDNKLNLTFYSWRHFECRKCYSPCFLVAFKEFKFGIQDASINEIEKVIITFDELDFIIDNYHIQINFYQNGLKQYFILIDNNLKFPPTKDDLEDYQKIFNQYLLFL